MVCYSQMKIHAVMAVVLLLGGCAGIPADRGFSDSQALVVGHGGPDVAAPLPDAEAQRQTAEWLAGPLTIESAQRIALTRNPRLLQQYARLGIAQAEVYDAARISNPLFSLAWLDGSAGGAQVGLGLAQNFADLLYLSPRKRRASGELARTQHQVAGELLKLAAEVEAAYYLYMGAVGVSDLREALAAAGKASAELAQRFFDAGNINRLELNREKAAATEARIEADRAATQALAARTVLNKLLGLTADEDRWTVVARLPLPVNKEDELSELQRLAQDGRLDLVAARQSVVLLEDVLGVTRSYRLVGDIQVGVDYEHETDGSRLLGPTLGLTLPIFNWGSGRIERARAELEQASAEARRLEIEVSNEVLLAQAKVANARGLVERYRTQLIPQREEVVLRAMEMHNFMIIGQFELLLAKREEYAAYQSYLETLAGYWAARAELAQAVGARLPSSAQIEAEGVEPKALITPKQTGGGHGGHGAASGMSGMDMIGGEGMDHSGHNMGASKANPEAAAHAGHEMKDMEGMDASGRGMETMPKPDAPQPGADLQSEHDMKGKDQGAPTAAKSACDRLKSADMNDPLMQVLAQKCREQAQPDGARGMNHSSHAAPSSSQPTPGTPPAVEGQPPSVGEHNH